MRKSSILAVLVLLPATVLATEPDTAAPRRIDVEGVFVRSVLLPAWGSYASESYLACTIEAMVDVAAVGALVALAASPGPPGEGGGVIGAALLGAMLANRAIGAPVNAGLAVKYNRSPGPARNMRLPKEEVHGRIAVDMGYAGRFELVLGAEWKRAGLMLTRPFENADGWGYTWKNPDGDLQSETYAVEGLLGLDAYYRLGLNAFMDFAPGLRCDFELYHYGGYTEDPQTLNMTNLPERVVGPSVSLFPHAAMVFHPYRRWEWTAGIGYALIRPDHLQGYLDRLRALDSFPREPSPWRLNTELAISL